MFWKISRSYTKREYADNLDALRQYNQGAYESLLRQVPTRWSRPFFKPGFYCNDTLNNISESFNKTIIESIRKPLLDMLEDIRRKCAERNAKGYVVVAGSRKRFTPRVDKEIEKNRQKARECERYMTRGDMHEIDCQGIAYKVDMITKTYGCGCGYWQLNGIPCMHVMCVITTTRLVVDDYVSDYYTSSRWQQLYFRGILPVQGMNLWPQVGRLPVLPPPNRVNRGRPNDHARRKAPTESSSNKCKVSRRHCIRICSNCLHEGHNKTKCSLPTILPQPKRPRGRPKKDQVFLHIFAYDVFTFKQY